MTRPSNDDGIIAGIGCLFVCFWLAWFAFIVWAIYSVVTWVTSQ